MGTMAISMMAVALLQLLLSVGYGEDLYISTAEEYLTFSRSVTSGEHIFLGETVYITDDLDFEGLRFEPPGSYSGGLNYSTSFCGSLNGNGHLIKNIRYEEGERWDVAFLAVIHGNVTFENVIVDSSCVFNNTYDHEFSSTAGVLGYASCVEGIMDIRNCVNLGGVAYSGPDESPTLGNVVAYIEDNVHVTNCVGAGWAMAKTLGFVGGLIGYSMGASVRGYAWITNCFWDINTYEQGGLGLKIATKIINFYPYNEYQQVINLDSVVSGGNNYNYNYNYNGGTDAGGDGEDDTFNDEMDVKKRLHAFNQSAPTILEFLQSSSDPSGIKYPVIRLNTMGGVELKPLLRTVVKVLPVPMREGYTFAGWYDSPTLTTPFVVTGGKGDDVAYAKWNIGTYYVRFEMNVGDGDPRIDPVAAKYNSVVSLPRPKKKNYEFEAWCRDIECSNPDTIIEVNSDMNSYANFKMPGYNVTFYPKWKASESSEKRALIIATVVCAVAVVVAVAAVIATILTYEHQRRRRTVPGMTVLPDGTITLDSGYFLASNIDLSKSTLVKALDSFPVLPDVKTLDFGPNGKLRLDSPYQLKFTIKNVSRTKLCWELFSGNVDKYTLIFNPDRGILSRVKTTTTTTALHYTHTFIDTFV